MTTLEPKTSYSTLKQAADKQSPGHAAAKAKVVVLYHPFILSVVAVYLLDKDEIEDVAHDFILKKLMGGTVLENYKPPQRFRPYLRTCVRNYCIDYLKKKRGHIDNQSDLPDETDRDWNESDAIWARTVFAKALAAVKEECKQKDQLPIWNLFLGEVVHPLFFGTQKKGPAHYSLDQQTYSNRRHTGSRKFKRLLNEELKSIESIESQHALLQIICELLKVPISNEPLIQKLLSKSFRDDEVSAVFLSDGISGDFAGLHPPIDEERDPLRARWLGLLQTPIQKFPNCNSDHLSGYETIDDAIFQETVPAFDRLLIQKEAKQQAESSDDFPHACFALYTLMICRTLVDEGARTTTLNTNQLLHNILTCKTFDWIGDDAIVLLEHALRVLDED